MLIYRHYKLHLRFDTVWRHVKNLGFKKMYPGYLLEIGYAGFVDTLIYCNYYPILQMGQSRAVGPTYSAMFCPKSVGQFFGLCTNIS